MAHVVPSIARREYVAGSVGSVAQRRHRPRHRFADAMLDLGERQLDGVR